MLIRTYRARNLKEALGQVKDELGEQATILSARSIRSGLLRSQLEITATPPAPPPLARLAAANASDAPRPFDPRQVSRALTPLRQELRALQAEVSALSRTQSLNSARAAERRPPARSEPLPLRASQPEPRPLDALRLRLVASGMRPELGQRVAELVTARLLTAEEQGRSGSADAAALDVLAQGLSARVPVEIATSERPIALVGPPGVGKTTTLAKIAARASLLRGRQVGLVASDDEGMAGAAAIEELSRCLEVPCVRACDPASLRAAVHSLRGCELILMDVAGQGPRDVAGLAALTERLSAVDAEVLLCLNADLRPLEIDANLAGFAGMRPTALIFSKLDQAVALGALYDAASTAELPVMYLATGKNIPDDIIEATPQRIASLVMGLHLN